MNRFGITRDQATPEEVLAMLCYSAIYRDHLAVMDAAHTLARSPHWHGGRSFVVVPLPALARAVGASDEDEMLWCLFDKEADNGDLIVARAFQQGWEIHGDVCCRPAPEMLN